MDDFLKYFEDERFIQWVLNPSDELNNYWKNRISENHTERKKIQTARLILQQLKSKQQKINREEASILYSEIACKLNNNNKKPFIRRYLFPFLRYAAVALIFLSLGILMFNQYNKKLQLAKYFPIETIQLEDEARLILSDGKKITLFEKESTIEYAESGKIIINRKDTIAKQKESPVTEMNQLIMPYGKSSSIRLPDGTVVYLNAGSTLMYPNVFREKEREVFLLGEAYFEVAYNPKMPFVVKTNELTITALGTIFNVSAYPTDKIIETVLVEGEVIVSENSFKLRKKEIVLKPNDLASFNRESLESDIRPVDVENYTAWRLGYLNFQSEELNRIVIRLERYYNIKIFLDNPVMSNSRITGKLILKEEKEKVLEVLASAAKSQLFTLNESTYGLR